MKKLTHRQGGNVKGRYFAEFIRNDADFLRNPNV
jgi:hypothetical protein